MKKRLGIVIILLGIIAASLLFISGWLVFHRHCPCAAVISKYEAEKPIMIQVHCPCVCASEMPKHETGKTTARTAVTKPKTVATDPPVEKAKVADTLVPPPTVVVVVVELKTQPDEEKHGDWINCRKTPLRQEKQTLSLQKLLQIKACQCN